MREFTTTKTRDIDYVDRETLNLLNTPFCTLDDCYRTYSAEKENAFIRCVHRVYRFCEDEGIKITSNSVVYGITEHNSNVFTFTCITPKGSWVETRNNIYFCPQITLDRGDIWEIEND